MPRVLTLDAAMALCSAGLVDGDTLLGRVDGELPDLATLVETLFADHGRHIDRVVVTVGPGSFTGLRASIALAHGIGLAAGVPVLGVTVGAAMAGDDPALWTAIDSKRGRVFLERDGSIESVALNDLPLPTGPVSLAGDAALDVGEALAARGATIRLRTPSLPDPVGIANSAACGHTRPAQPVYIEPPAARPGPASRPPPA